MNSDLDYRLARIEAKIDALTVGRPDPRDIDRTRIRGAFVQIAHAEIEDPDDVIGILDAALAASPYLA